MGVIIKNIINGTNIYQPDIEPSSYSIQKSDLYSESTGRSAETGTLLAYPIRRNIYKIQLEFCGNDREISLIEKMIDNSSLEVTFLDGGYYITRTMYPSDREKTAEIIRNMQGIYSLSFSLTEY